MAKSINISERIRSFPFLFIKAILLFCFIYPFSLRILGFPEFAHSARVAVIFVVIFSIFKPHKILPFKANRMYNEYKKVLWLTIFTCIYCIFLSFAFGFGTGTNYLSIGVDNILFSLLPIVAFYYLFDNLDEFIDAIILVTIIQSIAILLGTFIPSISYAFQMMFDTNAGFEDRDLEALSKSYASGIGCFTSSGVTRFTIGLVACLYKYISKRNIFYLLLYVFFSVVNSMLARTGLLMSIAGLFVIFYFLVKSRRISFISLMGLLVVAVFSYFIVNNMSSDFDERFSRYEEFKDDGVSSFFEAYFYGNDIPKISLPTIIGTSIVSGKSGNGIVVSADGGFIKNYVALGLILSIFVYVYLVRIFFLIKSFFKGTCIEYVLIFYGMYMLFSDFKEYFLLYRGALCLFFVFVMLAYNKYFIQDEKNKNIIIYR